MIWPLFMTHPNLPPYNADANYTMTLQQVCEITTGIYHQNFNKVVEPARIKLFDFEYTFWSDNADLKREFETEFIRHFFMREIGYETYAYFKLKLEDAFVLWMPYYSQLMKAALKAADLDWTLTDDFYIDYYHQGTNRRNINDNNQTVNAGTDTRHNYRNMKQNVTGENKDTGTIKDEGTMHSNTNGDNNSTRTGTNSDIESGSTSHSYDKAVVHTDTPQNRFQQGGRGDEFALDALEVKMDYASIVDREKYRGSDEAVNKTKTMNINESTNNKIDENTDGNSNNTRTLDTRTNGTTNTTEDTDTTDTFEHGAKVNFEGIKTDNGEDNAHDATHESGRRGVAWIDIYDKYMKAIRNIQDDIFKRFDTMLFLQIWG